MKTNVTHTSGTEVTNRIDYEFLYNTFYFEELRKRQYSAPFEFLMLMDLGS